MRREKERRREREKVCECALTFSGVGATCLRDHPTAMAEVREREKK